MTDGKGQATALRFTAIAATLLLSLAATAQSTIKARIDSIVDAKRQRIDSLYRAADSIIREHRVVEKIDSLIDKKEAKADFDRRYIMRPKERWTLKARLNIAGANLTSRSLLNDEKIKTNLNTDLKTTVNFAASYRGISLGLGMNPLKLFQKNSDYELNINSYGQKFGFDVVLQRANSFKGTATIGDNHLKMPRGIVSQTAFTTNFYYSFNYRHFSWAAALSQSVEQRRSAGSFLLGASFLAIRTKNSAIADMNLPAMRIYMGHIGIGGGYAYNYVINHHWLIHASYMPTVVVVNRNNVSINGEKSKMPYYFPSIISTGRFAVIRYYRHYFAGMTAVINTSVVGHRDHQQLVYTKWRTRLIAGIRF